MKLKREIWHTMKTASSYIWHSSTDYQLNNMKLTLLHHQKSVVLIVSKKKERKKNAVLLSWVY